MATVSEVLKAAGITDEVAAGLPKEVISALTGYVSEADTKLSTAAQKAAEAEEARRQAEIERKEINTYVESYGTDLTKMASVEAENAAMKTYLASLKTQGFDVNLPGGDPAKPVVPGSPAIGGNAVDEGKILGKVGDVMSQWLDANNEHIRLYGTPIPDGSTRIAEEASRARKPIGQYIAEKYQFSARQTANQEAAFNKKVEDRAAAIAAEKERKRAEEMGSNPNLRPGEPSRSSFVPKIKGDEFHKADGNIPTRERRARMLEGIRKDVEAARSAA